MQSQINRRNTFWIQSKCLDCLKYWFFTINNTKLIKCFSYFSMFNKVASINLMWSIVAQKSIILQICQFFLSFFTNLQNIISSIFWLPIIKISFRLMSWVCLHRSGRRAASPGWTGTCPWPRNATRSGRSTPGSGGRSPWSGWRRTPATTNWYPTRHQLTLKRMGEAFIFYVDIIEFIPKHITDDCTSPILQSVSRIWAS